MPTRSASVSAAQRGRALEGCGGGVLPPVTLADTGWAIVDIDGAQVGGEDYALQFDDDGRFSGQAGCNRFSGPYAEAGRTLTPGPITVDAHGLPRAPHGARAQDAAAARRPRPDPLSRGRDHDARHGDGIDDHDAAAADRRFALARRALGASLRPAEPRPILRVGSEPFWTPRDQRPRIRLFRMTAARATADRRRPAAAGRTRAERLSLRRAAPRGEVRREIVRGRGRAPIPDTVTVTRERRTDAGCGGGAAAARDARPTPAGRSYAIGGAAGRGDNLCHAVRRRRLSARPAATASPAPIRQRGDADPGPITATRMACPARAWRTNARMRMLGGPVRSPIPTATLVLTGNGVRSGSAT